MNSFIFLINSSTLGLRVLLSFTFNAKDLKSFMAGIDVSSQTNVPLYHKILRAAPLICLFAPSKRKSSMKRIKNQVHFEDKPDFVLKTLVIDKN